MENQLIPGIGVCIGRFQTPYLHKGHIGLLEQIGKHEKGIVFVGCAPTPVTRKNPLDFLTRKSMIQNVVGPNVVILPIADHSSDFTWSTNLDRMIREVAPFGKVILYHSRDSFKDYYHGNFTTVDREALGDVNATNIREAVAGTPRNTEDFRAGVIYASYNMYPRVQPTVDIIPYKENGEILMGRKPGSKKWCFVGGFIDMTDVTAQAAAVRELKEETGLITDPRNLDWLGCFKINDWRDTPSTSVMTTCFKVLLDDCENNIAIAADDIEEVKWMDITKFDVHLETQSAHTVLLEAFIDNFNKCH